jgi:DNA helicase IV
VSTAEIQREQQYVSMLYGRLDDLREQTAARLAQVLLNTGGNHQALSERDAVAARCTERVAQFSAAEPGLCFGRLDFSAGEPRYVGRLGLFDEAADYEPVLIDWRAPAARPFYVATAATPEGVRRRRHIRTRLRTVVGLEDEMLDRTATHPAADDPGSADLVRGAGLVGEAALLAALTASRTGRMADIVETIQAEQDRVIREPHGGVLVVQGGPGTGKTAVALHRAAYLLYTYRRQLSRRGVLIVGPNATFLSYIEQVLPGLGETGVVLSTVAGLYPGVTASRVEPAEVAAVKGQLAMAGVVAAAVRDRQQVPASVLAVSYDGGTLELTPATCARARELARSSGRPHNAAAPLFAGAVLDSLARQLVDGLGRVRTGTLLAAADVEDIHRELRADAAVRAAITALWPTLTPQLLLTDLYADAGRLAAAAPRLTAADRRLLRRAPGGGWTEADVPLLDEAAELLGEDSRPAAAQARRDRLARTAAAQRVLDVLAGSAAHELDDIDDWGDHESLTAVDLIDADRLADRHTEADTRTVAERAAADRSWTYGHVIVDEAQELSAMAWRLLMRRCPSRSMTLVGDIAQTGNLAGADSWQQVLEPYVADRWRLAELTVNYRMPAEIMAVAAGLLAGLEPPVHPPRSVRQTGVRPWRQRVPPAALTDRLGRAAAREAAAVGAGRLAVLLPASRRDELAAAVAAAVPSAAVGDEPDLDNPVVVLTVKQAKGLEFDSVLVADPDRILTESPRGRHDLYVALTRATQRLGVVHSGPPPAVLAGLAGPGGVSPSRGTRAPARPQAVG